ncbi:hypothetical protein [Proteiniphilum saccharofermentans]|nr:hypothetical protein [Proteiniphilum saccharofermentans]
MDSLYQKQQQLLARTNVSFKRYMYGKIPWNDRMVVSSVVGDFKIAQYTFEVGGRSKTQEQIKNRPNAFIVKDNIEYGYKNVIPLWAFGLNY